jgi:hypothetical protein
MTKISRKLVPLLLILSLACATTAQTTAYKTIGAVVTAVDAAMTVYGAGCRAGTISVADQAKVQTAYAAYQAVVIPAIQSKGLTAGTPADVTAASSALLNLLTVLGIKV